MVAELLYENGSLSSGYTPNRTKLGDKICKVTTTVNDALILWDYVDVELIEVGYSSLWKKRKKGW